MLDSAKISLNNILEKILPADGSLMFKKAIWLTLQEVPLNRAFFFDNLAKYIQENALYEEDSNKTWTYQLIVGTDGSHIFKGGIGFSLVVDPTGRIWRAATLEDFETTYTVTTNSCEIATMTPIYVNMKEYVASFYLSDFS